MPREHFRVKLTNRAIDDLRRIGKRYGKKTYETVRDLILDLEFEPKKKGEPLKGKLAGLYSRHYSRFRIIYHIRSGAFIVLVVGCGFHENESRKDIYKLLERAIESGRLVIQDSSGSSQGGSGQGVSSDED